MLRLITIIFCLIATIQAQAQLFEGGFTAGPNFSQIEGDDVAGYKKIGMNLGILATINFNETWVGSFELTYTQKGSRSALDLLGSFKIVHDYVEIPLILSYQDKGGLNFGFGLAPAYHITSKRIEEGAELTNFYISNPIKQWDVGAIAQIAYRINDFSQVQLRITHSVIPYQQLISANRGEIVGQFNNVITLKYAFLLTALQKDRRK